MKKLFLLVCVSLLAFKINAQTTNTFPSSGNVGIGTISPSHALTIEGDLFARSGFSTYTPFGLFDASAKPIVFRTPHQRGVLIGYRDDGAGAYSPRIGFQQDVSSPAASSKASIGLLPNGDFTFTNGQDEQAMVITPSGRIGIGTSSPATKLEVVGSSETAISLRDLSGASMSMYQQATDSYLMVSNALRFYNSGGETVRINPNGNMLIGKTSQSNADYKFDVAGKIRANEIVVNTDGADFVFAKDYKLRSLADIKAYIDVNGHLPGIPSAKVMQDDGVGVSELQTKLLQKIEELTLYVIQLSEENLEQKIKNADLELRVKELEKKNNP